MTEFIAQLNDFSIQVFLLISVIILKFSLAKFIDINPWFIFTLYCQKLANKVNKPQHSVKQKQLSGFIAFIITLFPVAIILWLFGDFIVVTWLWHALLLFLALGEFNLRESSQEIAHALTVKQKQLARATLAPLVLRNVDTLSPMGLCKATIEMQILRYAQQYFMISCYFLFVNPLAALLVRLLLEMHYCWNRKQPSFSAFGQSIAITLAVLQWLPTRLLAFILMISNIGHHFIASLKNFASAFFQPDNNILLVIFSLSLDRQLGGVALYEQQKIRKVSFNSTAEAPSVKDIIRSSIIIRQINYFCISLLIIAAITSIYLY